jgi:hypothetical protein
MIPGHIQRHGVNRLHIPLDQRPKGHPIALSGTLNEFSVV